MSINDFIEFIKNPDSDLNPDIDHLLDNSSSQVNEDSQVESEIKEILDEILNPVSE